MRFSFSFLCLFLSYSLFYSQIYAVSYTQDGENSLGEQEVEEEADTADAHMAGATEHHGDEDHAENQKKGNAQISQVTISLRDDWLHRGDALQDIDLQMCIYVHTCAYVCLSAHMCSYVCKVGHMCAHVCEHMHAYVHEA